MRTSYETPVERAYSRDASFLAILRRHALHQPESPAYIFLPQGEEESFLLTYGELAQRVQTLAFLLSRQVSPGERALLLYPPGLDYIVAFLGCLAAGVVAVPAYPPSSTRSLARIQAIVADAQATLVLTTEQMRTKIRFELVPELSTVLCIATDGLVRSQEEQWPDLQIREESLAFLQYTSGSTGMPKGVMVSHGNLLWNSELLRECWQHGPESVMVSWLPMFHDMGLIAGVLQPLYVGFPAVLMPPAAFLQRPLRWLEAIARYRGTTSCAPNFAYELCLRRATPEGTSTLDLSSWRVAVNGAEPVRAETLQRFTETFAGCGFQARAFSPGYGLAESTLMVSCTPADTPPTVLLVDGAALEHHHIQVSSAEEAVKMVGCGREGRQHQIAVVDPATSLLRATGEVGEIWVAGPSVAQGYWRRTQETEETFQASIAGSGHGPFLRTGDLGFLYAGELFITGRIKDLIIIRGRNFYPQDIEQVAEQSHESLRAGSSAAFSLEQGGEERLVLVQEVRREYKDVSEYRQACQAIRQAVSEAYEIELSAVILVRQSSIAKTSSGKIQRRACREEYLQGRLHVLYESVLEHRREIDEEERPDEQPLTRAVVLSLDSIQQQEILEAYLRRCVGKVLGIPEEQISVSHPLSVLGIDSLKAAELKYQIEIDLSIELTFDDVLAGIGDLRDRLQQQIQREIANVHLPFIRWTGDVFPLSFAQEQIWFLSQLQPESPAYTISFAFALQGRLDREVLIQSLNTLVERHEALRTTFLLQNDGPRQRVQVGGSMPFILRDLSRLPEDERAFEIERLLQLEAQTPFRLAHEWPVRTQLLKVNEHHHILQCSLHHIISDRWSVNIFVQELSELYQAYFYQRAPVLPALPVRPGDYSCWQRESIPSAKMERDLEYWREQLRNVTPLHLPLSRSRPARQSYKGAVERIVLPEKLVRDLRWLSAQEGCTLFMTLLAAFQVLLMRYSGQEDIIVGTPGADRFRSELAGQINFLVHTLALRTDLSGNPSMRTVLQRVRTTCLQAYMHQDVAFSRVVEAVQPERDLSRNPLFQVFFVYYNMALPDLDFPDILSRPLEIAGTTSKFDLTATFQERDGLLLGEFEYNTDLFDAVAIRQLMEHYSHLLRAIVCSRETKIRELDYLSEDERRMLLEHWSGASSSSEAEQTLALMLDEQAARSPEREALWYREQHLSYAELIEKANRLATYLRRRGVGPEVTVGLCLERSPEMVIGVLAVLKAGGAYLPLDPAAPVERQRFILGDANARFLLSQRSLRLPLFDQWERTIYLDEQQAEIARQSATAPASLASGVHSAYVLYTSGSTGRPKGVRIPQRALVNLLKALQREPGIHQDDTLLALTTLTFDIATLELLLPLSVGARIVIAERSAALDGRQLIELLESSQATILQATPTTWRMLLQAGWQGNPHLRGFCGGEALTSELASQLRPRVGALWNMYGPTETTIYSVITRIDEVQEPITIGRPITNTQTYILDAALQPTPVGVIGELYIGGAGLAHGYVDRPDLTAERFLPHPFSTEPGARLYRSGDLARYRPGGAIECLGRIDHQVKIRGLRIELGEIESLLVRHESIAAAVVAVQQEHYLVAYVVLATHALLQVAELQAFLRRSLPDYMVPAAFIALEALPLTASGKVNRNALPALDWLQVEQGHYVAPRTPIEEILVQIWEQELGRQPVGIDDDFFASGGHSLLAARVIARCSTVLGRSLPVSLIFEAPTIMKLAQALTRQVQVSLPLSRSEHNGPAPLSFEQQRLWFLDQLEQDLPVYTLPVAFWLDGMVDIKAFAQSIQKLVERHDVLRTRFILLDGEPAQIVADRSEVVVEVVDGREWPLAEREARALDFARRAASFNLRTGPLLRALLVQVDSARFFCFFAFHHSIIDGWSLQILFSELSAYYKQQTRGISANLPEPVLRYRDYARWQRQQDCTGQLRYWKEHLADLSMLELPTDFPRPLAQTYRGATQRFILSAALTDLLRQLSREEGVTLFMLLLAVFQVFLHRYTGQEDIAVGTAVSLRTRPGLESLPGMFVNTIVLRNRISGAQTFQQLLGSVRARTLAAYAHQETPFEQIVEALCPVRDLARSPLFQVVFAMQPDPFVAFDLEELEVTPVEIESGTAKFDLSCLVTDRGEQGLHLALEYNTDLFEAATIARMIGHFRTLLEAVVVDRTQHLALLPLLTAEERTLMLETWNETAREYRERDCLHRLFEEQVRQHPAAIAVVDGDQHWSYAELEARANQIAHYLRAQGVGLETRVGICIRRSGAMIAGMLGILKAGATYVPLDAEQPQERLAFLIADARIELLLTGRSAQQKLAGLLVTMLCLESDAGAVALSHQPIDPVEQIGSAQHLAYIIYTSGSTGKPKGVGCSHSAVVNLLADLYARVSFKVGDHCSLWTSISFDVSVYEIFSALCAGATLSLVPEEVRSESRAFLGWLKQQAIQRAYIPPFLLADLAQWFREGGSLALEWLLVGVEPIAEHILQDCMRFQPGLRIVNGYGPTEATIYVTLYEVEPDRPAHHITPLGRPLQNTEIYLLDAAMQPVPIGVHGEIYIGGKGLARGYRGRPERTAAAFVPHPFSKQPGARLYKTGDLAYYLPDHTIQFVKRRDQQIKIRGFRVEPGEVEFALKQHSMLKDAAVVPYTPAGSETLLAAYVVPADEQVYNVSALRQALRERLPSYMMPGFIVALPALPLTTSGKLDRKALPGPEDTPGCVSEPPLNPVEEILQGLWRELLQREHIARTDNFFDLGGHSLLATRLQARIQKTFGMQVPLRLIFERPTIADLAGGIKIQAGETPIPKLVRNVRGRAIPLSFAQQRLWFLAMLEPESPSYLIAGAVRIYGSLDLARMEQALQELVKRHETLRTAIHMVGETPVQVIAETLDVVLPGEDVSALPEKEREARVVLRIEQAQTQMFDLGQAPLWRVQIVRVEKEQYVLILAMHHIISDGWSLEIVLRELSQLYEGAIQGKAPSLAPLTVQYADYALWQRDWLQGEVLQKELAYWRQQLADLPPLLLLPLDYPRPLVQSYRGASQAFRLPAALTSRLRLLSQQQGVTLFMTLLAAFQVLLFRYSGQEDIAIGTPVANRRQDELEPLVGFFANTLTIRTRFTGNPDVRTLLTRVRETCLQAYSHQDVPFEQVVEALQPERLLNAHPLFQVFFAWQQNPLTGITWPGGKLERVAYQSSSAKFDLSLLLHEEGDELAGVLEYSSDLFNEGTIARLIMHWQVLLEGFVDYPDCKIESLPLLTPEERMQQTEWNTTAVSYAGKHLLHSYVEEQVQRTPLAIAVRCAGQQLTYVELNERANKLAGYLQSQGVGPDICVGLMMERSLEMVVALLAVLKAGGAFVPLDPSYPAERLAFMVRNAGVRLGLCQPHLLPANDADQQCTWIIYPDVSLDDGVFAPVEMHPDNLAYILYTSGSTGQPKGVMNTHRGICNRLLWGQERYPIGSEDRVLHKTPLVFDVSLWEIFWPLMTGACLVLADPGIHRNNSALAELIDREQITLMHFVPSLLQAFLSEESGAHCRSVRRVICSGEALSVGLQQDFLRCFSASLFNFYGPTEAAIEVSHWMCQTESNSTAVPIGMPIANLRLRILNRDLQLVPAGVAGELYIGGVGLARGYANQAGLTAERFLPDPLSSEPGERLYRTGDLARYRPDGAIEFLGRLDSQIKLRGMRIELAEIESALGQCPGVRECAVVVREEGGRNLVAYVVSEGEASLDTALVRQRLQQRLPEYMIPPIFVTLPELPRTSSGKIDRRTLPSPLHTEGERYIAPRNSLEKVIADIWRRTLRAEDPISVEANFFSVGGHSLMATSILTQVQKTFKVLLPLHSIFKSPTIAGLAQAIVHHETKAGLSERIADLMLQVQHLSDDEVRQAFHQKKAKDE